MAEAKDITELLESYAGGNRAALDHVFPMVYDELQRIAHGRLRGERDDHTLDTGALVHEAYIKLARLDQADWKNRSHFFAIASTAMRHILVDYALAQKAQKRGGNRHKVRLDEITVMADEQTENLLELHEALSRLEQLDERQAQIVTYRFFGGLNIEETAEALTISPATVSRDWTMARAWLHRELSRSPETKKSHRNDT
jgi:RNA polymerase sigma factor (TIGR02999 family)